ncbi:MAG: hypothetical protein JW863_09680, partial [Chitinispirillaceae bacterium]|nr:hypothetical protein [Chitinispirillaceae bacterium]
FYDEALSRGWRIGATGSGDNHNGDWGTATDSRIGIPAPALTRDEIRSALGARRFYSTLDRNIQLSFKADSSEMGSTVAGCSHRFSISARDGDDESFTEVFLYNSNHDTVATWYPEPGPFTISFDMTVRANDYFYVRIAQEDGGGAISSPIWVSCSGTAEQDP